MVLVLASQKDGVHVYTSQNREDAQYFPNQLEQEKGE